MAFPAFTFLAYIKYLIKAKNEHSLHSPFVYELYLNVLKKKQLSNQKTLAQIIDSLKGDHSTIKFTDPKTHKSAISKVSSLSKKVASSSKFSFFLIRLIHFLKVDSILEAGTSIGLNAVLLSHSDIKKIITIEGSKEIATFADETFSRFQKDKKIKLVVGSIYDVFQKTYLNTKPEVVFIDADHRSSAIDFYLNTIQASGHLPVCIVIHDIYWSRDMNLSWEKTIKNPIFNLTIDVFEAGLIFPNYPAEKQHFILKF